MRTKPNYFYAIISVALVLFLLGFFVLVVLQGQQVIKLSKEKVEIIVELKENTSEDLREDLSARLAKTQYVKENSIKFISKEEGAELMRKEFGEEFILLDMPNPLYDVLTFNVKSQYMQPDSLSRIREVVRELNAVSDVFYQESIADEIINNIQKLSLIALVLGIFLLFVAFVLIHNTIRLALYANRFIIKNMELVGASWDFISRPYIFRSMLHGLISGVLAIAGLVLVVISMQSLLPELGQLNDFFAFAILGISLVILGILISCISTWFVVNKYLKMRVDDLY
jgi:cell division transport system permease protein